jgi:spore coat protein CotH
MIPDKIVKKMTYVLVILMLIITIFGTYVYTESDQTSSYLAGTDTSYIEKVFDEETLGTISIDIEEDDWQWLLDNPLEDTFVSCNVTIAGSTFYNVGIKPKGNSSLSSVASSDSDRYSFKLDFGEFVEGQTCFGLEAIALNNSISDNTLMKEYLSYELYDLLGVETPEYSYNELYVNGTMSGLYFTVEDIDTTFIERVYETTEGNLYKPEGAEVGNDQKADGQQMGNRQRPANMEIPEGVDPANMEMPEGVDPANMEMPEGLDPANMEIPEGLDPDNMEIPEGQNAVSKTSTSGGADLVYVDDNIESYATVYEGAVTKTTSESDFESIIDMIESLESGEDISEHLDVETVLKYFAVNTYLVNLDSYSGGMFHNYYLYENDGLVTIIPWDLNMSFGGFSQGVSGAEAIINFPIDSPVTGDLENYPLIASLLENEEYKALYHTYLQEIYDEYYASGLFDTLVDTTDALINESVKIDTTSFVDYDTYVESLDEIKVFMAERSTSILAQLSGEQPSETTGDLTATVDMTILGDMTSMGGKSDQAEAGMRGGKGANVVISNEEVQVDAQVNLDGDGQQPQVVQGQEVAQGQEVVQGQEVAQGAEVRQALASNIQGENTLSTTASTSVTLEESLPFIFYIALIVFTLGGLGFIKTIKRKRYFK